MPEQLLLLPGWGLGQAPLQPLAERLSGRFSVRIEALPALATAEPEAWLDALDARLPTDSWLAGWSLGGMLASALAARRGERCRGLLTLASNACFVARATWPTAMPSATFAAFRAACASDERATLKRFASLCSQGAADARQLSRRLLAAAPEPLPGTLLAGLDLLHSLDGRAALRAFAGPQLHLLAGQDALLPASAAEALRAFLPAAEVRQLEGASHAGVVERADEVAQTLVRFISEAGHA
ncbi:alpha/beta fold hydrolase [Phytopseudomonas dryadis]|uniref:Transporter n=1 Tax=Phytopseudomonas dryadis TaxID=2487520 RepID=A0A4Q9R476_9GAMM|nr:alpha/beta fold hydrolase [Pseudomonas dryadis]TBU92905.1 transporter [Pseudomonas dryadis]